MNAVDMAAHIEALAAEHDVGITIVTAEGFIAFARPRPRRIWIPPVVDLVAYYTALHELGHVVGKGRSKPKLEAEANAWVYAIRTARWPLTDEVRNSIRDALRSYGGGVPILKSGRPGQKWRPEPPVGHAFWSLREIGDVPGSFGSGGR
jgi:hypothetical protein